MRYKVYLIHENMEGDKIVGIEDHADIFDHISKKHDKVLEYRGSIQILGDIDTLNDFTVHIKNTDLGIVLQIPALPSIKMSKMCTSIRPKETLWP